MYATERPVGVDTMDRTFVPLPRMLAPISAFIRHRALTYQLAKRDVLGRYRGASFGLLWSLMSPFLMLMVYTFAFGTVLKSKWPQLEAGHTHYSIILFVGVIVHSFFAECLTRSPGLVVSNQNFVKRVIFPLEVLPVSMVFSALFHLCTNILIFIVLRLLLDGDVAWTMVFAPIVLLPLFILTLGVAWFLASAGVYFRDIGQIVSVLATAMFFLSSAMLPIEVIPESYRWVFFINPLTFIIDQARNVMLWQEFPDWSGLGLYCLLALCVAYLGHAFFEKTRRGFADVL
ncbi:ABC transporter permease [Mizugakiibacter sediminis]